MKRRVENLKKWKLFHDLARFDIELGKRAAIKNDHYKVINYAFGLLYDIEAMGTKSKILTWIFKLFHKKEIQEADKIYSGYKFELD